MGAVASTNNAIPRLQATGGLARILVSVVLFSSSPVLAGSDEDQLARGRELFTREWKPNDPRSHGGDGLGPVYNETSCVACHSQGGPGGGGPVAKNVELLTISGLSTKRQPQNPDPRLRTSRIVLRQYGAVVTPERVEVPLAIPLPGFGLTESGRKRIERRRKVHPGFKDEGTIVLHRFGPGPSYQGWRSKRISSALVMTGRGLVTSVMRYHEAFDPMLTAAMSNSGLRLPHLPKDPTASLQPARPGDFLRSWRNAPPLFGAGLIDTIQESDLVACMEQQPEHIRGFIAHTKDGGFARQFAPVRKSAIAYGNWSGARALRPAGRSTLCQQPSTAVNVGYRECLAVSCSYVYYNRKGGKCFRPSG